MIPFYEQLARQFTFNADANLFYCPDRSTFAFLPSTPAFIDSHRKAIIEMDKDAEQALVDFCVGKALAQFFRINQYYHFNRDNRSPPL